MSLKQLHETTVHHLMAWKIASDQITLPVPWVEQTEDHYDFPPALIPLWRNDIRTVGFWYPWFCKDRSACLVEVDPTEDYRPKILANSFSQLLITFVMDAIEIQGKMTGEMNSFIQNVGLGDPMTIGLMLECTYGDPKWEEVLKGVAGDPPSFLDPGFQSHFFQAEDADPFDLFNYSGLEIEPDVITNISNIPPWLKDNNKQALFNQYLAKNQLKEAWLTLHSEGWDVLQMETAVDQLQRKAEDPKFSKFAAAWVAMEHQSILY